MAGLRRGLAAGGFVACFLALATAATGQSGASVLVVHIQDVVTPVVADHVSEALDRAVGEGHRALLVEMDTPGGLDRSMRDIVQEFLGAEVPVVVYVAPSGARAASAGAVIAMAAHVAAMAPGTNIGAATPVDLQGGEISDKIVNDAAAYVVAIARARDRNTEFAEDAVRDGRSATAEEAVQIGVVDLMAEDRAALLDRIDGRAVELPGGREVELATAGAQVVPHEMSLFRRILQWLADPNLAFLFLSLGTLAIIYEVANPGIGAGGILGVIMILLALFALSVLPVNALGIILLVLGAGLFVAEVLTPGVGVFAFGGSVSLVLGGIFLFRGEVGVDPAVLWPVAVLVGGGVLVAGRLAWRTRSLPQTTGTLGMIGHRGEVRAVDGRTAQVLVDGSWWKARSRNGTLTPGQRIRVVEVDGLELIVEPEEVS